MKNFDHLEIVCPLKSHEVLTNKGIENRYLYSLEKMIAKSSFLLTLLRRVSNFYRNCEGTRTDQLKNEESLKLLKTDSPGAGNFGSGYGYADDANELQVALNYQKQIETGVDRTPSESSKLYAYLESKLTDLLSGRQVTMLNFGVSHAYIDSRLAAAFPGCRFVGVDRSAFTQLHNQRCFGGQQNLEFLAEDVFALLSRRRFDGGVFFHTRTLCLLPKTFIQKLYRAVYEAGFQCILGVEQIGLSRHTHAAYQFSEEDKPSELFRSGMYIHNYPHLVQASGFRLTESELVKTNHPHRDYRFLSYLGDRES